MCLEAENYRILPSMKHGKGTDMEYCYKRATNGTVQGHRRNQKNVSRGEILADLAEKEIFKPKPEGRKPAIHAENQGTRSSHRKCESSQVTEKLTCSNGVKAQRTVGANRRSSGKEGVAALQVSVRSFHFILSAITWSRRLYERIYDLCFLKISMENAWCDRDS